MVFVWLGIAAVVVMFAWWVFVSTRNRWASWFKSLWHNNVTRITVICLAVVVCVVFVVWFGSALVRTVRG